MLKRCHTRNTKIVATLGPASSSRECIASLVAAGTDVFRLNLSHGSHKDHQARLEAIRSVENQCGRPIGVILDLQGPKLRIGAFQQGKIQLIRGAPLRLDLSGALGDETRAPLPHPEIYASLVPGAELLLDDGKVRLRVDSCGSDYANTTVIEGRELSDRKGLSLPGALLRGSILTGKDLEDLTFGLEQGVDWVALSFVQRPEDVAEARRRIAGRAGIISKIEKPAALTRFREILELSDAIMIARGDLGIEMPPEDVPGAQKAIVRECRRAGKPVIVATHMLDSMVRSPAPTRAEASDVATAVYEGADAVMLSAESASGRYPVESVAMMSRIIERVEGDAYYRELVDAVPRETESTVSDAISVAARQIAQTISAAAIVTFTSSGSTVLRAARERPSVPVFGATPEAAIARRLALTWGVRPRVVERVATSTEMVSAACRLVEHEILQLPAAPSIVIVAGLPFGRPGTTNLLRIAQIQSAVRDPAGAGAVTN